MASTASPVETSALPEVLKGTVDYYKKSNTADKILINSLSTEVFRSSSCNSYCQVYRDYNKFGKCNYS